MKRKKLILSGTFIALLAAVAILPSWFEAVRASSYSCVVSISQRIADESVPLSAETEDWQVLSSAEALSIIVKLENVECGSPRWFGKKPRGVDSWGNQFQIAVRKLKKEEIGLTISSSGSNKKSATADDITWLVWSLGPDGKSGTPDDITSTGDPAPSVSK
jgi:hypothetical protein